MPSTHDAQPAPRPGDQTTPRAKVAAACVLAALGIGGMTWSILRTTHPSGALPRQIPTPRLIIPTAPEGSVVVSADGTILSSTPAAPDNQDSGDTPSDFGPPRPGEAPDPAPDAPATNPPTEPGSATPANQTPPSANTAPAPTVTPGEDASPGRPDILTAGQTINLNAATEAQLQLLPGIGPSRARAIVEDRSARGPFRSIDDLDRVRGIGAAIIEDLRPFARVN